MYKNESTLIEIWKSPRCHGPREEWLLVIVCECNRMVRFWEALLKWRCSWDFTEGNYILIKSFVSGDAYLDKKRCVHPEIKGCIIMKTYLMSRFCFSESCFPNGSVVKNPPAYAGATGDLGSIPGLGRKWQPHSSILAWHSLWAEEPGSI